jgi:hypothetical protein
MRDTEAILSSPHLQQLLGPRRVHNELHQRGLSRTWLSSDPEETCRTHQQTLTDR